ncbi:hypothetical protein LWE61_19475 [Sphingobium sufflavum]|uniref:hypothetical protein n=1 Tax=Sphingobium sufflavum TaxID=1129547 RepID=UPI001F16530B|nr:hypothetical protein [Sphingobium sufflavum]MCE7798714.1 hypothetical protein [Sphingobium sufflavum]
MSKTITRLFDNYADASAAVADLESLGVPHSDLSIVANNADGSHAPHDHDGVNEDGDVTRGASTGAVLGGAAGLLAGLGLLAIPGLGPIVAAGWLAATAAGAGIGAAGGAATGGIVGALKNAGHSDDEAHVYSEGVRRGGTLVSAKVSDDLAPQAEAVLQRHRSVDAATRGAAYRESGWSTFDDNAPAYSADEVKRERSLYSSDRTSL